MKEKNQEKIKKQESKERLQGLHLDELETAGMDNATVESFATKLENFIATFRINTANRWYLNPAIHGKMREHFKKQGNELDEAEELCLDSCVQFVWTETYKKGVKKHKEEATPPNLFSIAKAKMLVPMKEGEPVSASDGEAVITSCWYLGENMLVLKDEDLLELAATTKGTKFVHRYLRIFAPSITEEDLGHFTVKKANEYTTIPIDFLNSLKSTFFACHKKDIANLSQMFAKSRLEKGITSKQQQFPGLLLDSKAINKQIASHMKHSVSFSYGNKKHEKEFVKIKDELLENLEMKDNTKSNTFQSIAVKKANKVVINNHKTTKKSSLQEVTGATFSGNKLILSGGDLWFNDERVYSKIGAETVGKFFEEGNESGEKFWKLKDIASTPSELLQVERNTETIAKPKRKEGNPEEEKKEGKRNKKKKTDK